MTCPLRIEAISKQFAAQPILKDITWHLSEGSIAGLVGLNGVGKTTLIKIILNLVTADTGSIWLYDMPATLYKSRAHIAYLPEKFTPSPVLTGDEFLSITLRSYGRSYNQPRAIEYATEFGLAAAQMKQRIGTYSKGMGQKLGLIATFLTEAPLLILDEPMSGLDPVARTTLKKYMLHYSQAGNSIFFSSHILADVEELCHQMAILHNSQLHFTGSPATLRTTYPSTNLEEAFLQALLPLA